MQLCYSPDDCESMIMQHRDNNKGENNKQRFVVYKIVLAPNFSRALYSRILNGQSIFVIAPVNASRALC